MLNNKDQETLRSLFYGSDRFFLQDITKLKKLLEDKNIDIPLKDVQDWYEAQEVVQLLKPPPAEPKDQKKYFPIIAWKPFDRFYMDTMFIPEYRLVCVVGLDLFSRYGYAKPYFTDSGITATKALDALLLFIDQSKEMGYKISSVWTDAGGEFKSSFNEYLEKKGIEHVVSEPSDPRKNRNVERFNKTLRLLIEKYIETYGKPLNNKIIERLIDAYNNTAHGSLEGRTPKTVLTDMKEATDLWKHYIDLKYSANQFLQDDDVLKNGAWVRWFVRLDSPFKKVKRNWSKALYQVESYDPSTKLYTLDGLDKKLRRHYLQVVDKEKYDAYNYTPSKQTREEKQRDDRPRRKVGITKDIRQVLAEPIVEGKRQRKAVERLDL